MPEVDEVQLNRICISLQAEDKNRRRDALKEIINYVLPSIEKLEVEKMLEVWETLHKHTARLLNDPMEVCRDLTIEILKKFYEILPVKERNIVYIMPILYRRLSCQELIEQSEEVRLNCVLLLKVLIPKYKDHLPIYMDDFMAILSRTVVDNYPNVKRESCECIALLANTAPSHFYSQSEKVIKPVLSNFAHQHYRVRVASVRCIGDIMQHGNSKSMDIVATPMAERLFDQNSAVRAAVIEVAGKWLVDLRDRYSWWHKIIPLLLTGLHDEIAEIRIKANQLWDAAGVQYLNENDTDEKLKDKMDFLIEPPKHYPPNIKRPNLGCRVIAQQNIGKLVNGINAELGDWLTDIRIRSAQLLCVLILNVEQDITQHIERLLPSMYRVCNEKDLRIVENVETAALYIGYFVPVNVYCDLVLPTLEETVTPGHLRVFAAILRGSQKEELSEKLEEIGKFLQQSHICQGKKALYQEQILRCCEALFAVSKEDCATISADLFTVLFTVLSVAMNPSVEQEAKRLLVTLQKIEELPELEDLYCCHLRPILQPLQSSCKSWTIYSVEFYIFQSCLTRAPKAVAENLDLTLAILKDTMNNEADPELRLKQFILLAAFFQKKDANFMHLKDVQEFTKSILDCAVVPGLIWSAGRAAEAIRTAAVCCLCALLDNSCLDENNVAKPSGKVELFSDSASFEDLFKRIVPVLISLVDDVAKKTRLYSLKAVCLIMNIGQKLRCLKEEYIHQTYPVVLKRLDDGCDDVRIAAIEALTEIWRELPMNYNVQFCQSHVDSLYTTTIIHLDDPEVEFQQLMLDAMMQLAKVHPELLHKKITNCKLNFRNQQGLDRLLEHTVQLLSASSDSQ